MDERHGEVRSVSVQALVYRVALVHSVALAHLGRLSRVRNMPLQYNARSAFHIGGVAEAKIVRMLDEATIGSNEVVSIDVEVVLRAVGQGEVQAVENVVTAGAEAAADAKMMIAITTTVTETMVIQRKMTPTLAMNQLRRRQVPSSRTFDPPEAEFSAGKLGFCHNWYQRLNCSATFLISRGFKMARYRFLSTMVGIVFGLAVASISFAEEAAASDVVVVEDSMHELMEYFFQPTYKRLKVAMKAAPADNAGWKAIKADSIILAEGSNLLLGRAPKEGGADWIAHTQKVREAGSKFYKSAKGKDFEAAMTSYKQMLTNCNACHKQFAKGKYQLQP